MLSGVKEIRLYFYRVALDVLVSFSLAIVCVCVCIQHYLSIVVYCVVYLNFSGVYLCLFTLLSDMVTITRGGKKAHGTFVFAMAWPK